MNTERDLANIKRHEEAIGAKKEISALRADRLKSEKEAIDFFIEELRARLHQKADEGFTGWKYDNTVSTTDLDSRLRRALNSEKYVDVAAFASMIWRRQVQDLCKYRNRCSQLEDKV